MKYLILKKKANFIKKIRKKKTQSNPNKKKSKIIKTFEKEKGKEKHLLSFSRSKIDNSSILSNNEKSQISRSSNVYRKSKYHLKEKNSQGKNIIDFEINSYSYKKALESDKRTFCQYYLYLIKTKIAFFLAFYPINDYNIKIIKICLFFLFFVIYLAVNTFFFNDATIHQIYEDDGKYNFSFFLPQIIYSFVICYICTTFIKYFSLSERNISEIQFEKTAQKANHKADKIKKNRK